MNEFKSNKIVKIVFVNIYLVYIVLIGSYLTDNMMIFSKNS